jgi:hypothetical protein
MIIKFKKYKYSVHFYCQNQRLKMHGEERFIPFIFIPQFDFFFNMIHLNWLNIGFVLVVFLVTLILRSCNVKGSF